ncbi:hypothetical protein ACFQ77_14045, partial [Streptomyces virginiae]
MSNRTLRRLLLPTAAALPMALALGAQVSAAPLAPETMSSAAASDPAATGYATPFTPSVANPATATAAELAAAAANKPGAPQSPQADLSAEASSAGGPISRSEVIARAQSWVSQGVPYSQTSYWADANGKYRQDCSGLVSMAWHLRSSGANNFGETTWTLPNFATKLGSYDDLKPGDMLDNVDSHVVLFKSWTDSSHTVANIIEEARPGTNARNSTYSRSQLVSGNYKGYRYDHITEDVTTGGDVPVAGNWDGGPAANVGVWREGTFHLRFDDG